MRRLNLVLEKNMMRAEMRRMLPLLISNHHRHNFNYPLNLLWRPSLNGGGSPKIQETYIARLEVNPTIGNLKRGDLPRKKIEYSRYV